VLKLSEKSKDIKNIIKDKINLIENNQNKNENLKYNLNNKNNDNNKKIINEHNLSNLNNIDNDDDIKNISNKLNLNKNNQLENLILNENYESNNINKSQYSKKRKSTGINENITKKSKYLNSAEIIKKVTYYSELELREPQQFNDIYNKRDKLEWLKAVNNELENMRSLKVYKLVNKVPSNANIITTWWVFTYKRDSQGNIIKRKARLVARGFTQIEGTDYTYTFSPTLRQDSLRILSAYSAQNNYEIHQLDVKAAYLNADLEEEIYMEAPEGDDNYKKKYWKLNKALYGLKHNVKVYIKSMHY